MALYHPEPTFNQFERERFERLKELFPDAFKDGEVNWEAIYKIFEADDSEEEERYGLNFPGKRAARQLTYEPPTGAIHPETESELEKTTGNVFIEGDNLEVLKHLRKAYAGRVKMIYIDPPYNTGNDFVYEDDLSETKQSYELNATLRKKSKDGKNGKLTTNQRTNGRFHSKWLSMMYPRLRVARDLLTEDGVIFISIDDNEVANIRLLMDELFGEENYIGCFAWRRKVGAGADSNLFFKQHENILLYGKNLDKLQYLFQPLTEEQKKEYSNPDNDIRGAWASTDLGSPAHDNDVKRIYEVISPSGKAFTKCWSYTKDNFHKLIKDNLIWWGKNGDSMPKRKRFLSEKMGLTPRSWIDNILTQDGKKDLENVKLESIFDYPKPLKLINLFLSIAVNKDSLILDFFAGSGTTGQAVMEMNAEDGGNRQFILVQLDEETNEKSEAKQAGYEYISEITKERLRRAAKKIREEKGEEATKEVDLDFRSFRVEPSHFREWVEVNYDETMNPKRNLQTLDLQLEEYLHTSIDPDFDKLNLTHFWGLVTEMALSEGFPLDSEFKIDSETYTNNRVLVVHHPKSQSELMVLHICFDEKIHPETVTQLAQEGYATFICHDSAIDDESKIRLTDKSKCLVRTF